MANGKALTEDEKQKLLEFYIQDGYVSRASRAYSEWAEETGANTLSQTHAYRLINRALKEQSYQELLKEYRKTSFHEAHCRVTRMLREAEERYMQHAQKGTHDLRHEYGRLILDGYKAMMTLVSKIEPDAQAEDKPAKVEITVKGPGTPEES